MWNNRLVNKFTEKNNTVEHTIETSRAHLYILALLIPLLLVFVVPFIVIWDLQRIVSDILAYRIYSFPVIIAGIITHELLHGLTWSLFVPNGMKAVKFGFNRKFLAPYCHCTDPMKVKHYRLGAVMPLLILGILPWILALVLGSGALLVFGFLFIWTAGGDIITVFMLKDIPADTYVSDHPDKMGFIKQS